MGNVTMSQIAESVGVSQATVSFVLNGRERANGSIGEETRLKVLAAAEKLGYLPNRAARTLATGTTHRIALWTRFIRDSVHHSRVIPLMAEALDGSPYELDVNGLLLGQNRLPQLAPGMVDGIIAFELEQLVSQMQLNSKAKLPPIVNMGTAEFIECGGDFVGCDLKSGARTAMGHLINSGAKRIAFFTAEESCFAQEPRYAAYLTCMEEAGLQPERILIPLGQHGRQREAYSFFTAYLKENSPPQALFCVNDEVAMGAYRALMTRGLKTPDDLLLVGGNGRADEFPVGPSISTIAQPLEEMCGTAWQFLRRRLEQPDLSPQQIVLTSTFVERDSSRFA